MIVKSSFEALVYTVESKFEPKYLDADSHVLLFCEFTIDSLEMVYQGFKIER